MKYYEYGVSPIREAKMLEEGELYVTSEGDIVEYNGEGFSAIAMSPLVPIQGNTVENLTDLQLTLYWTLCKTSLNYKYRYYV